MWVEFVDGSNDDEKEDVEDVSDAARRSVTCTANFGSGCDLQVVEFEVELRVEKDEDEEEEI